MNYAGHEKLRAEVADVANSMCDLRATLNGMEHRYRFDSDVLAERLTRQTLFRINALFMAAGQSVAYPRTYFAPKTAVCRDCHCGADSGLRLNPFSASRRRRCAGRTNYRPALLHSAAELAYAAGWRNKKTGATKTISASPVGVCL